jgi:transcriptional regulator with XRE-family HTH domain
VYTLATNTEVAEKLGLALSTVSRMRTGERVGSVRTLRRLSREFDLPLDRVMSAAGSALEGDKGDWVKLMAEVAGDAPERAAV